MLNLKKIPVGTAFELPLIITIRRKQHPMHKCNTPYFHIDKNVILYLRMLEQVSMFIKLWWQIFGRKEGVTMVFFGRKPHNHS